MSHIKHLQLVLPQVLTQLRATDRSLSLPTLQDWLRRSERQCLWSPDDLQHARLDPWQHALLHALPAPLRMQGLASAALQWRGEGGSWHTGTTLHADWVHLAAGMDDLQLQLPPPPDADEEGQLRATLAPLLAVAGFDVQTFGAARGWYLRCERPLTVLTYSPRAGFASRVYDTLPQGRDGAELRRVMTEMQMLLHEHPVNQRRMQRGVLSLNALWLWGAAPLERVAHPATQRVLSNAPYVQGLAEHLQLHCWPLPATGQALLSVDAEQVLLVLPGEDLQSLETVWFEPLQAALQRGDIECLEVFLDHWQLRLQGGRWQQWRRRWARPHELAELLA